nr:MAG TPA: hypothetical protein [Caudoviricetes sp.]
MCKIYIVKFIANINIFLYIYKAGWSFFEGDRPSKPTPTSFYTRGEFSKRGGIRWG